MPLNKPPIPYPFYLDNLKMHTPSAPWLVRDLMTVGVTTCSPDTPVIDVAKIILDGELEGVVILDEGNAIGVISQEELVDVYAREDLRDLKAMDIMIEYFPQIPADIPLKAAAQVMRDQEVRAMYITHHSGGIIYPAAVISCRHLIRHMAAADVGELSDLGINAEREAPLNSFIKRRNSAREKRAR
jgi:CBS domain-containing protein